MSRHTMWKNNSFLQVRVIWLVSYAPCDYMISYSTSAVDNLYDSMKLAKIIYCCTLMWVGIVSWWISGRATCFATFIFNASKCFYIRRAQRCQLSLWNSIDCTKLWNGFCKSWGHISASMFAKNITWLGLEIKVLVYMFFLVFFLVTESISTFC